MKNAETFLQAPERRKFVIRGTEFELEINEHVFPPSANGFFYADSVEVNAGETLIDIGTGSGVLAIFAAKRGAIVSATDLDSCAIETARRNAGLNKVDIEFNQGSLFADFGGRFDVILANLPNEIVHETYLADVGGELSRALDGGAGGNRHILDLLRVAKRHMHERSRLYLPVHTLTDYHETLRQALAGYRARLVAVGQLPTKEFVGRNIGFYSKLNEAGVIRIFLRRGEWHSNGYVFELSV
ncbi:MAG: 50S ribosomal protein L11 methyltransferase [Pyrinomonadaceae bacterium]